jgi:hypothetical protein
MRHIVIDGLPCYVTFFPSYIITGAIVEKKLLTINCVF